MPLLNSMGVFRAMSVLPTGTSPYYFNALDLNGASNDGTMPEQKKLTVINDTVYQYGYTSTIVSSIYVNRPYIAEYMPMNCTQKLLVIVLILLETSMYY
jgi:hypothetical protein